MASADIPNPYTVLGVAKDAQLPEIRSAHRKLVLKCHPDKVQDPTLKAIKQDEFQKVQEAYELLSDESRRLQYDDSIKLAELRNEFRKEMARNAAAGHSPTQPSSRSTHEYEVRTAEPRASTFKARPEPTRVYTQPTPRSYEDDIGSRSHYEEPLRSSRKPPKTDDRKRTTSKEEDRKLREKYEKEAKRSAQGSAKKSREKERKKGVEEKFRATYGEGDDSDDIYRSRGDRRSNRKSDDDFKPQKSSRRSDEERTKRSSRRSDEESERTQKLNSHTSFAAQYMQAARRKGSGTSEADFERPKPVRRAETYREPAYSVRYSAPEAPYPSMIDDDDDYPHRSRAAPRRSSHEIPTRSRESRSGRAATHSPEPYIVEASHPSSAKKPPLQSHSSAPPIVPEPKFEPRRSKTIPVSPQYSRRESSTAPPPLPRASTFQYGERPKASTRGSKLKEPLVYSDDSDSDGPRQHYTPSRTHSPPPAPRRRVPVDNHCSALREDDYAAPRDRSVSPRGSHRDDRPSLPRGSSSTARMRNSPAGSYFSGAGQGDPVVLTARPKELSREHSSRGGPFFGEVRYAPKYTPEDATYAYRRGSEPIPSPGPKVDYAYNSSPTSRSRPDPAYARVPVG